MAGVYVCKTLDYNSLVAPVADDYIFLFFR